MDKFEMFKQFINIAIFTIVLIIVAITNVKVINDPFFGSDYFYKQQLNQYNGEPKKSNHEYKYFGT
ncbi:MAG: hypothetical protein HN826_03275 [Methylococcales bacterium]|nr:hypothetical protein [Methylococcales bacterium]